VHALRSILVLVAALALGACGREATTRSAPTGAPAIRVAETPVLPQTVDELPPVDVAGYVSIMAGLRGTPTVVNFWATWCPPCLDEMPMIARVARDMRNDVQFIGVNVLDDRSAARSMLRDLRIPYPNVFDETGAVRDSVAGIGQPVTVFYRADGSVAAKVDGELSPQALDTYLDEIV
jgi:thiol-disulfide isomerase/thioredoxin